MKQALKPALHNPGQRVAAAHYRPSSRHYLNIFLE